MNPENSIPSLPSDCTLSYISSESMAETKPPGVIVSQLSHWEVRDAGTGGGDVTGQAPIRLGDPHLSISPTNRPAFQLRSRIGIGGMGEVWEARQTSLKRVVAVKRIRPERLNNPEVSADFLKRDFLREALIAGILEHPNIIPVHDLGVDPQGELLLAMKRVHGQGWDAILREDFENFDVEELLQKHLPILIQVSHAVAFAHAHGIVHRDLKPAQVLVGEFGEVLLVDWGLAIRLGETLPGRAREVTEELDLPSPETASNPSGTPALMAPEQTLPDALKIGTWTDIYLLGGILYYLLTRSYPHQAESGKEAFRRASEGFVQPPADRAPGRHVPEQLSELTMAAMQLKPKDRIASAENFIAGIQDYLTGAGRRRESQKITEQLNRTVKSWTAPEYADFAESLSSLEHANSLWPFNPEVPVLREALLERYARAALLAGDLLLARIQAGLLSDGKLRTELLDSVALALRESELQRRQRRLALRAVAALAFVVVAGGALFIALLHRKNKETTEQRAIAEQQRAVAEQRVKSSQDLVNFMLKDLADTLDLRNEHDQQISSTMTEQVLKFVDTLELQRDRPEVQLLHATFLDGLAKNFRYLSLSEQSMKLAEQSLAIRRRYAPDDKLAQTLALHEIGAAFDDLDQPGKAEPIFREILEERRSALGEADIQTVRAYHAVAVNLQKLQKFEESIKVGRQGVEAALKVGPTAMRELSHMQAAIGGSFSMSGNNQQALEEFTKALEYARQLEPRDPGLEMMIDRNMGVVRSNLGESEAGESQLREAVNSYTRKFGPAHPDTISAWSLLYKSQREAANYAEALKTVTTLCEILSKHSPDGKELLAHFEGERLRCFMDLEDWQTARTFVDDLITTAPMYLASDPDNRRNIEAMMIRAWEQFEDNALMLQGLDRLMEIERNPMQGSIRILGELQRMKLAIALEIEDYGMIQSEIAANLELILANKEFAPEDAWYNAHLALLHAGDLKDLEERFAGMDPLLKRLDDFSDSQGRPELKETGRLLLFRVYVEAGEEQSEARNAVVKRAADLAKKHDVPYYYEKCLFKHDALFLMDCLRAVGRREDATPSIEKLIKDNVLRPEARAAWDSNQPMRLRDYVFAEQIRNEMQ